MSSTKQQQDQQQQQHLRPSKKRVLEDEANHDSTNLWMTTISSSSSSSNSCSQHEFWMLQQQLETAQAELDHERALRGLDQKRHEQVLHRMEQRMQLAVSESQQAVQQLEDFQRESEKITTQLQTHRNQALQELRRLQIRFNEQQQQQITASKSRANRRYNHSDDDDDDDDDEQQDEGNDGAENSVRFWKKKCQLLTNQLQSLREQENASEAELIRLRTELEKNLKAQRQQQLQQERKCNEMSSPAGGATSTVQSSSPAPPAVLKELNRVRISLAEAERQGRQLTRQVTELQQRLASTIQEREQAFLKCQSLPTLQQELSQLRRDYEMAVAEQDNWKAFGKEVHRLLRSSSSQPQPQQTMDSSPSAANMGPPDASTIVRFLDQARSKTVEMEQAKNSLQAELRELKEAMIPTESKVREYQQQEREWKRTKEALEFQVETANRKLASMQAQQLILQRENESLLQLIQTFEQLPPAVGGVRAPAGSDNAATTTAVSQQQSQVQLQSARQEVKQLQQERDRLLTDLEAAMAQRQEVEKELDRVKDKFGKLRDALQEERSKVEVAEQRACQAEALAGKGSFNAEHTRVLHLEETPLISALKEEIAVLKRQLETAKKATSMAASSSSSSSAALENSSKLAAVFASDPDKLNQRLKENFKEQIARFREGVYLMTGFKFDMIPGPNAASLPTFRVRSVFAEQEQDHLLFQYPESSRNNNNSGPDGKAAAPQVVVTSLDMLNTDLARLLATTPSYDYLTRFHSLPAFLASVQLSLFEKQTVMI